MATVPVNGSAVIGADELTVLEEEITDQMIQAYIDGTQDARQQLMLEDEDWELDLLELDNALNLVIDGKTYIQRIREGSDPLLVADTETHRMYNTGMFNAIPRWGHGNIMKTWHTMEDDRVRDTHWFIDGVTVPAESMFYTFDGDYARFPGDFTSAENNCRCRCTISLSWI